MTDLVERLRDIITTWDDLTTEGCEIIREAADEIERLRAALDEFADVARWAERNGHDLMKGWDMILRGPGGEVRGHLGVQSIDFINALRALRGEALKKT